MGLNFILVLEDEKFIFMAIDHKGCVTWVRNTSTQTVKVNGSNDHRWWITSPNQPMRPRPRIGSTLNLLQDSRDYQELSARPPISANTCRSTYMLCECLRVCMLQRSCWFLTHYWIGCLWTFRLMTVASQLNTEAEEIAAEDVTKSWVEHGEHILDGIVDFTV